MQIDDEELKPQRNSAVFPVITNIILLVLTVGFLWGAVSYYEDRITAVSLNESRFITTEWHILQELKAQTDRQLQEKDKEIAALRRQYRELVQGDADPQELQALEAQLQKAREEREDITSRRLEVREDADGEEAERLEALPFFPSSDSLTELLRQEIETLEAQLSELREEYRRRGAENRRRIEELSSELQQTEAAVDGALEELEQMKEASERREIPQIDDLKTGALLQAIVSSPEIRAVYPDLAESMDRYLRVLALGHRLEGRRDAYADALEVLEPLEEQIEVE